MSVEDSVDVSIETNEDNVTILWKECSDGSCMWVRQSITLSSF